MTLRPAYGGNASASGGASLTPAAIAAAGGALAEDVPTGVRRGAVMDGSGYVSFSSPTDIDAGFNTRFRVAFREGPSNDRFLYIRSNLANRGIRVIQQGSNLLIRFDNLGLADIVLTGAATPGEPPASFEIQSRVTGHTVLRNGQVVGESLGSNQWVNSQGNHEIGATINFRNVVLWDVEIEHLGDDTKSVFFPLDGLDSSGNFENTHPGSTVADATVTGLVTFASVLSSDGGKSVPVGRPVLLHSGAQSSDQVLSGDGSLNGGALSVNESGGAVASTNLFFVAPSDGFVQAFGAISVLSNSGSLDSVAFDWSIAGAGFGYVAAEVGSKSAQAIPVVGTAQISKGQTLVLRVSNVAGGTSFTVDYFSWSINFYPST